MPQEERFHLCAFGEDEEEVPLQPADCLTSVMPLAEVESWVLLSVKLDICVSLNKYSVWILFLSV